MKPKHADDGSYCPLWRDKCVRRCHTCEMWEHFEGTHPQTNKDMTGWYCSIKMQSTVGISVIRAIIKSSETVTATVDALRKEVAESHDASMVGAIERINHKIDAAQAALPNGSPQRLIEG